MGEKGDIRMKTLPFTEQELCSLIYNARNNYCRIMNKIAEEEKEYLSQNTKTLMEQHYDILNRLHQQAMIYSNQIRKYASMQRIMYGKI